MLFLCCYCSPAITRIYQPYCCYLNSAGKKTHSETLHRQIRSKTFRNSFSHTRQTYECLNTPWDHKQNTLTLWKTIHGLGNNTTLSIETQNKHYDTIQQQSSYYTQIDKTHIHQTIHQHNQTYNIQIE